MQPYYCGIEELPGLKPTEIELLKSYGIVSSKELIERAATFRDRQNLANSLKLRLESVNKWLALADLARVPSINCQYCGLVLHSGIVSLSQLTHASIPRLHQQLVRLSVATTRRKTYPPL